MKTRRLPALHCLLPVLAASILWGSLGWGQYRPGGAPQAASGTAPGAQDDNPSLMLTMLSVAIERNPRNARAYNERAKVYARMGKLEEAVADYTRALEIEPTFAQALGNRGMAHRDLRQFQAALADFDRLIALRPDLAKAYQEMGDREGAREILREVIAEGDDDQKAAAERVLETLA